MEFDDQMRRFFGTDDLGAVSPAAMASGIERMLVEFGLETDKGSRFAMWSLLWGFRNIFPKSSGSENGGKQPFWACPFFYVVDFAGLDADSELMPPPIPRNSRPGFRSDPAHLSD